MGWTEAEDCSGLGPLVQLKGLLKDSYIETRWRMWRDSVISLKKDSDGYTEYPPHPPLFSSSGLFDFTPNEAFISFVL